MRYTKLTRTDEGTEQAKYTRSDRYTKMSKYFSNHTHETEIGSIALRGQGRTAYLIVASIINQVSKLDWTRRLWLVVVRIAETSTRQHYNSF